MRPCRARAHLRAIAPINTAGTKWANGAYEYATYVGRSTLHSILPSLTTPKLGPLAPSSMAIIDPAVFPMMDGNKNGEMRLAPLVNNILSDSGVHMLARKLVACKSGHRCMQR